MAEALVMPKLGLSMTEGTIVNWLRKEGDNVKKGDGLVEIETEKITNTVEAQIDGVLLKIIAQVGDVYPIAETIAYIGELGEKLPDAAGNNTGSLEAEPVVETRQEEKAVPAAVAGRERIKIAPVAKVLAEKLNIDYTKIAGTGPGGRIIKEDILKYSESLENVTVVPEKAETVPSAGETNQGTLAEIIPYAGMRKAIGTNMSISWNLAPQVTHHVQVDVTPLLDLRQTLNSNLKAGQVKLSVTDMLTKIVAKALTKHPIMNNTLTGDKIKLLKDVNMGIAVSLNNGLIVPVVKNADKKDVFTISKDIKELSGKARSKGLQESEMTGSTFTISNVGSSGSVDFFTPIINQPESAILGVCRTQKTPVVINDEIVIRSMMGLSLTFDHRVIDGSPAAEFLATIISLLENPARAIFE